MKINKENGINKIDDVIKVLRRTNKNSYNINVVYIGYLSSFSWL